MRRHQLRQRGFRTPPPNDKEAVEEVKVEETTEVEKETLVSKVKKALKK